MAAAASQDDHDRWRERLVTALERLDARLAGRRCLLGDAITESDVRLWPTLARFDLFYNPMSGADERPLPEYPNLWPYARDLYQTPAFRDSTDFSSFRVPKPGFVNDGVKRLDIEPREADWEAPHGRGRR